ncbi:hypothetical protein EPN16_04075 [bacterium]|nr:MAG: hypothetical protein EPN16_04075 [bacterium]
MEDIAKNRVIAILGILVVIFLLLFLGAKGNLSRQRNFANERAARAFELEDKIVQLEKEKSAISEELKNIQAQLAEEKGAHDAAKKTLSQEQVAESALKVELERVTRLKETLEKDLKEALGKK